ncbi:MAG: aldolase/citrate lyase family protein [Woeseiaceae bacterium]|nr:aldolase/citrate lyase family protein [Woeseiaceae bacterium]
MGNRIDTFRKRLRNHETIAGTFIKTPSSIVAEVLGLSQLDVVCIDAEHAPFGRLETDQCIAAFRAADMPCLVRIPGDSPHDIRNALDSGATGILVPHVTSADQAAAVVKAANFGEGGRGYAGSPRAAAYTTKRMNDHLSDSRDQTTVIVQIEDLAALDHVEAISAVDGVDAVFVGRVDLSVAMREPVSSKPVIDVIERVCSVARGAGTTVGMFTPSLEELPSWKDHGASLFLLDSDQGFLLEGARQLAHSVRD